MLVKYFMPFVKDTKLMKSIISLFFIAFCSVVSATTYYVSTTGKDNNPGTITQPWATFHYAVTQAYAGDTVYFRGGTYYWTERVVLPRSGTAGNHICFFNYPDEIPIFDCSNYPQGAAGRSIFGIFAEGRSYLKFKGLTVNNLTNINLDEGRAMAFYIQSCNNIFYDQCNSHHCAGPNFQCHDSRDIYYTNCDISWSADPQLFDPGNAGHGFTCTGSVNGSMEDTISYYGCRAWKCSDQGYSAAFTGLVIFDHCWAFDNGLKELGYSAGAGHGFKPGYMYGDVDSIARILKNCLSVYNAGYGFLENTLSQGNKINMRFYNNTSYKNGRGAAGIGFHPDGYRNFLENETIYRNNIGYDNFSWDMQIGSTATVIHDHNSWDCPYTNPNCGGVANLGKYFKSPATVNDLDFVSLDSTGLTGARKADGSLPDLDFLKLAPTSDLIDKGIYVGLPYSGTAPDLGYSEYLSGSVTPPSPVYVSSGIENATPARLEMTYNLSLANIVPAVSAFSVMVNSSARTVSSVAISGTKVLLTLSSPVVYGNVVTVAYTKPASNPLQTASGGQAAPISAQTVTNNCRLPENQPPVTNIVSPGKSSSFIAPATIVLDVDAYDPDGTIIKVEFFNGSVEFAEIATAPYSFTWKDVPVGTYSITAVATDNLNQKGTSEPVIITVSNLTTAINQLPVVNITSPYNNSSFEVPQTITLTVNATDADGTISRVEYYSGISKIGESFSAPFSLTFEVEKAGSYEITAIAYDNLNAFGSSSPINLYAILYNDNPDIINLYPNPNQGRFTIDLMTSPLAEKNTITIVNITGKTVYKGTLTKEENTSQLDLSHLDSGIYILMISNNKIGFTKKFIKI